MEPIRRREAVAAAVIGFVCGVLAASPALQPLRGFSIDALTTLRWHLLGARHDPASSPTVVIALDEETYRTPPFKGSPAVTWTRELGRVIGAVADSGASVIGVDVIFPTSIEESQISFDNETLGTRMRGFDRDFLRALAAPARAGKLVLGEILRDGESILPAAGQRVAVGQQRNIRALNVYTDADEVVRRIPLALMVDAKPVASMAVELAARALGTAPEFAADRSLMLAGYRVPMDIPNTMTVNFEGGSNDIPTYSLADLRTCLEKGNTEFFRRHFDGKVVIVGSVLDFEDRKLTPKRFVTTPVLAATERCALSAPSLPAFKRNSIDGVFVQATAVNNLLRREAVIELGFWPSGVVDIVFGVLAAFAALTFAPARAVACVVIAALIWLIGATMAFDRAVALPLLAPYFAACLAFSATTGFRVMITDKDKRLLRRSFTHYLAPSLVEKMVASRVLPVLGGETRTITVFFSDLAGFSIFSQEMKPAEIVSLLNRYLAAMTEVIEEHGGFVDKYIGDGILAVFGAPVDLENHAAAAVSAAMHCCERLAELNHEAAESGGQVLAQRIGMNSGEALVGNIGSRRRFNYTVIGEMVNLASRLEGANKHFGTSILASQSTMSLAATTFLWRELDAIRVKGFIRPVAVYQPLAEAGRQSAEQTACASAYARGLEAWRNRDFAGAAAHFARVADIDPPSATFLARANKFAVDRPDSNWEPVHTLEVK